VLACIHGAAAVGAAGKGGGSQEPQTDVLLSLVKRFQNFDGAEEAE
jgi:hypothetical protein